MADAWIAAALRGWRPRFTSQGVDPDDVARVAVQVDTWPEWLRAWFANGDRHAALAREAEERGRSRTAGEAWLQAALSYHFAKFVWSVDLDLHRQGTAKAIDALTRFHRLRDPTAERLEIGLDGFSIVGNLRRPGSLSEPPPLVVLLGGLDSTKEEFSRWEEVFLARGLATLSLDGPGQGEVGEHSTIYPDFERAVTAALDAVHARSDLDLDRIGIVGVSLGGYYAPRAAAYEPRIKAVVGVSGPFDLGACWESLPARARDVVQRRTGSADHEQARERAHALTLRDAIAAIEQPLLCITGRQDAIIPWEQTKQIADEAPRGEFVLFDEGDHVCFNIPYKYRPLAADWIAEHLSENARV